MSSRRTTSGGASGGGGSHKKADTQPDLSVVPRRSGHVATTSKSTPNETNIIAPQGE